MIKRITLVFAVSLLLQGCLYENVEVADSDNTVVTHYYAGPNTPVGEFANLYLYLHGDNDTYRYGTPPTDPAALPYFSTPDPAWVREQGLTVTYDTVEGRCVCRIHPREGVKRYVLYLHGGYYVSNMMKVQYKLLKSFVEELGYGIVIPDYPLCAAYTYRDAYAMVTQVYAALAAEAGAENILLYGDSAGGGFCLGLAQWLHRTGGEQPAAVILISPWLDVTLTNRDIGLIEDPMLNRSYGQLVGTLWAGDDTSTRHYQVSPIYGDLSGLPRLHVFIGGRDMLYPDVVRLRDRMRADRQPLTVYEYPQMFHDFVALPALPEAKDANKWIIRIAEEI